ncbi:MAG: thioredoxin family protein, partial [Verrucomicrobiota bacterium]
LMLALAATVAVGISVIAAEAWGTDYAAAQAQAKKEGKAILIDFTGSDWCGWCIKMKKESLDQKAFTDFAAKNVVLVEVDFPNKKALPEATKKQNNDLKKQYKVNGFPTFVLIDADGKELGRQVGYLKGGPDAFIAKIGEWKKASK